MIKYFIELGLHGVQSHSNKFLHHLEGNSCIFHLTYFAPRLDRVVKSQEVYCIVSTLHNTGSFNRSRKNLECFSTNSHANNSRRTNSIYFFDTGSESSRWDGRINGCTWSIQFSRASEDASRTRALFSNPRIRWSDEARYFFPSCVFPFVYFVLCTFSFFFILSTVHDCAPRAVTLSTRRPLHNLEIYFHLRGILQMNRTSRIDENKANLALALAFEIRYEKKNFSQSFEILTFRLKNKLKARLFDVWFCRCYIQL